MNIKMLLSGWSKNLSIYSNVYNPINNDEIINIFLKSKISNFIPRGLGRSYGDSSLADNVISLKNYKKFYNFDEDEGIIECSSNYSLDELIKIILKKGWFFNVTPGSKFVTIGGAIASDVHGKNHHRDGSFADFVESFRVMIPNGELVTCSDEENAELFHATAGGMGLCGIIVDADLKLRRIQSGFVDERIVKTNDLCDTLACLDENDQATYVVAWLDAIKRGTARGRALVMIGEHAQDDDFKIHRKQHARVPFDLPSMCLNRLGIL